MRAIRKKKSTTIFRLGVAKRTDSCLGHMRYTESRERENKKQKIYRSKARERERERERERVMKQETKD